MIFSTTISPEELVKHIEDPDWAIIDCRFKLDDPMKGWNEYETGHIPGAVYASLDKDLSGPVVPGITGRHPLPTVEKGTQIFSGFGIDSRVQVVTYDDAGGTMAAARAWWLLRWLGHDAVAVLDGGLQAWEKRGYAIRSGNELRKERQFIAIPNEEMIVTAEQVDAYRQDPQYKVLDARSADRFRGENEVIDPIPGHIPEAISTPYAENLDPDGAFKPDEQLAERFKRILGNLPTDHVAVYCGSGVTAAHDILAMEKAGQGLARFYPGSYSEWITDPKRPVAKNV
jgi:thiosulfate/3-mercaptopyruvate sulfurtransferase